MKKIGIYLTMLMGVLLGLTSCDGDQALPPLILPEGGMGSGVWNSPKSVKQVLDGSKGTDVWVTGYIVGWIDTNISNSYTEENAKFTTPATIASNMLLAATPDEKDITKCVPVQLVSGTDARAALNLVDHPENLGKAVTIKGSLEKYFGTAGVKSVNAYNWGTEGIEEKPVEKQVYKKVDKMTPGKTYLMVADGETALNITGNYGYFKVEKVTAEGGVITTDIAGAGFYFEAAEGGYYLRQASDNRYIYLKDSYTSFNAETSPVDGSVFTVEAQADGRFKITNTLKGKYIQYSASYSSYGAYNDAQGTLPELYELQN